MTGRQEVRLGGCDETHMGEGEWDPHGGCDETHMGGCEWDPHGWV